MTKEELEMFKYGYVDEMLLEPLYNRAHFYLAGRYCRQDRHTGVTDEEAIAYLEYLDKENLSFLCVDNSFFLTSKHLANG